MFAVGADQVSATWAFPRTPERPDGAEGVVYGIYAEEGSEYVPVVPAATCATRKMYDVPFVRPVTVLDVALDAV